MVKQLIDSTTLKVLSWVDTPTVCNAIEVAQGKRGFDAFTKATVQCSDISAFPLVGFAKTAKIAGRKPSPDPPEEVAARRMDYYRYMAESPEHSVAVVEDCDYPDCVGAYWGEINAQVHKAFGIGGVLTNGVLRDLGDLPGNFPIVAGSLGPSHGFVHVTEIDVPVKIFGLEVAPGALIHADRHGAVSIPLDIVGELSNAIGTLLETEKLILDPAQGPDFDFAAFEKAWAAFEKART